MTLRVLLVGCGEHSTENLIPSLAAINLIEITALCDPNEGFLERAHRWFPNAIKLNREVLTKTDILNFDAIVVAAPPMVHERMAQLALEMSKPIFVEKPPTITTSKLQELSNLAEKNRIVTCVGHNLRHSDAAVHFRSAVDSPQFGRPVAMEMRYLASKPRGARWGLTSPLRSFLLSHANHAIDLMIYQMGELQEVVAARAWPDVGGGIAISAQFIFASGAVGTLLATSYAPHFMISATVVSDSGCVAEMNGLHEVHVYDSHELGKRWSNTWTPRTLESGFRSAGYQTELERFFIAVQNRTPESVHPSFKDEVAIYKAMDSIEDSIEGSPRNEQKTRSDA